MRNIRKMRFVGTGIFATLIAIGCSTAPQGIAPLPPSPTVLTIPDHFSGAVADAHIASLVTLGPRPSGSPADMTARRYLRERFEAAGAEVRVMSNGVRRHLLAELPGDSADVLLLVAAYPTLEQDDWIGDSGAALLVELARVLALEPRSYTLRFALAQTGPISDGRGSVAPADRMPPVDPVGERSRAAGAPMQARRQILAAGESLAQSLAAEDGFGGLRGVLVFEGPARPNLRVARDLRSHPVYREIFWDSAAGLGLGEAFPKDAGWASAQSLHLGFKERGMDRVLALVDEAIARPERAAETATANHSAASLDSVGRVTIEALTRIMHRLSRIDAFSGGGG